AIVDHQRQTAAALFLGPADPAVPPAQPAGGGAKNQRPEPNAAPIGQSINELLADGLDIAQIMMLGQKPMSAGFVFASLQRTNLDFSQRGGKVGCAGLRLF